MRKTILAAAALAAALALTLCACGWQRPARQAGATTAYDLTEQQAPLPATEAAASKKSAVPAAAAVRGATAATTKATTTAITTTATTQPQTATQQIAATIQPVPTTATTKSITTIPATTVPPTTLPPFRGAEIVLAGPGRGIDESLHRDPHAVYAIDMGGRRFDFQPRAYSPGGAFAVDVYLDNRDGSYAKLDTFTSTAPNAGVYSIVLVTPDSAVTLDDRQNLTLITNVYRFELSTGGARYSVRYLATHAPYALTAYYGLDGAGRFSRFTF